MTRAFVRSAEWLLLGLVPAAAVVTMFVVAYRTSSLAADFHHEIYPQAKELLSLRSPYPTTDQALGGSNLVWPPLVAVLVSPLTVLPPEVADPVAAVGGLACFAAALWLVGVRDWRVFGAAALWAPVVGEIRTAHLTLVLCLLVALAWRTRDWRTTPGAAVGVAVALKLFLWPLGLWLASIRRLREVAVATTIAGASLLLLLPFTGIDDYARLLRRLGDAFDQDGYSLIGLFAQLGLDEGGARAISVCLVVPLLVVAWRRASFTLFVGCALLLSPIVWLDYWALLAVPLAVVRPTFGAIWVLPVLTWGLPSAGHGIGDVAGSLRVLAIFGVIMAYAARLETSLDASTAPGVRSQPLPTVGTN